MVGRARAQDDHEATPSGKHLGLICPRLSRMLPIVAARLVQAVFTLLAVTIIVFVAARLTGSPEQVMLPLDARPEDRVAFRQLYGLDEPIPQQYARWLAHVL